MAKTKAAKTSEFGENSVRFQCIAPAANNVFLAGTFNAWDPTVTPMQPDEAAGWYVELKLTPGRHEYKFIVDGMWCCEPGIADADYVGEDAVVNPFGTKNRVVEVDRPAAMDR